jgi:hypothetical protein
MENAAIMGSKGRFSSFVENYRNPVQAVECQSLYVTVTP